MNQISVVLSLNLPVLDDGDKGIMTATKDRREIDFGMSNFEGAIDDGFAEALRAEPNEVFGRHAGWNFNGRVWFADGKFHEEVWVYGSPQQTISADTLRELMDEVCAEYGCE